MGFKERLKSFFSGDIVRGKVDFDPVTAPNSTGNTNQVYEDYKAKLLVAHNSTGEYWDTINEDKALNKEINNFINQRSLNEWYLLQLQANYFANTIMFRCSDANIENMLRLVIRAAYIYGKAGMYYDNVLNTWIPVMINRELISKNGTIIEADLYIIRTFKEQVNFEKTKVDFKINFDNCKNLAVFKWGVDSQSALIYHYPFIRLQNQVLKQITLSSLILAKKVNYHIQGNKSNTDEIRNWLNPFKFILKVFNGGSKNGRFEIMKREDNDVGLSEIEYYKHLMNVYYSLFGRRVNDDVKKERNITDEVNATQENFDVLQENWLCQFRIFIKQLKSIIDGRNDLGEVETFN